MNPSTQNKSHLRGGRLLLAGLSTVVLLALFLFLAVLLIARLRPDLAARIGESVTEMLLERELQIGEVLELELGLDSRVRARRVSLANPDWAAEPYFARAEMVLVDINLPSLWREGPILFNEIELEGAALTLLAPQEQAPNWDFWPDEDEEDVREDGAVAASEDIFPVLITSVRIEDSNIYYRDPDQDLRVLIDSLDGRETGSGEPIALVLDGAVNGIPLKASGRIGPTLAILTLQDLVFDLNVDWGELEVDGRGEIADLAALSGVDLSLSAASPTARPLLDALGMQEVRDGPLGLELKLEDLAPTAAAASPADGPASPGLRARVDLALGEFDLRLMARSREPLLLDGGSVEFVMDGPSLAELGAMFNVQDLTPVPYEFAGELYRDGTLLGLRNGRVKAGEGRLKLEGYLPDFPGIDDWQMTLDGHGVNLSLLGPIIGVLDLPEIPYTLSGRLSPSEEGVELVDLNISGPQTSLRVNGVVGEGPDYLGSQVDLKLTGSNLAEVGPWIGLHRAPTEPFSLAAELALGEAGLRMTGGRLEAPGLVVTASGESDRFPDPDRLSLDATLVTADTAVALAKYGIDLGAFPGVPLNIRARIEGRPDQLSLSAGEIASGESRMQVTGALGAAATLESLDLALDFTSPDALAFVADPAEQYPALPLALAGRVKRDGQKLRMLDFLGQSADARLQLDAVLDFAAPGLGVELTAALKGEDLGGILNPWLGSDLAARPYSLTADLGYADGGLNLRRLDGQLDANELVAQLVIASLDTPTAINGELHFSGPSSERLGTMLGLDPVIPDADFAFDLTFRGEPEQLRLAPATLQWGLSDYGGAIAITPGDIMRIDADIQTRYMSLPFLLPDFEEMEQEEAALAGSQDESTAEELFREVLSTEELAERLIPDDPIELDWMRELRASLRYRAQEVNISEEASAALSLHIGIEDGLLTARESRWDGTFSSGSMELMVDARSQPYRVETYLDVDRLPVVLLLGGVPEYYPDALYRARLSASGNSPRAMAASLNGGIAFRGGGGVVDNKGMDLIMGDTLDSIVTRINPLAETRETTHIECHAGALAIVDGEVAVAPGLVMRTETADIAIGGSLRLDNERLSLDFNTRARRGIGVSASKALTPYLRLGGTLANPRLALDPRGVAVSGGAAIATGGLSLLAESMWDRWVATARNPCEILFKGNMGKHDALYRELMAEDD